MEKYNSAIDNKYMKLLLDDFRNYFIDFKDSTIEKEVSYLRTFVKYIEGNKLFCIIDHKRFFTFSYEDIYKLVLMLNDFFEDKGYDNKTIKQYIIMINHFNAYLDNAIFYLDPESFYNHQLPKVYQPIKEVDILNFREKIMTNPYEKYADKDNAHYKEYEIMKHRNSFIFSILYYTGIRITQLLELKFKDINFNEHTLTVDFYIHNLNEYIIKDLINYHELSNVGQYIVMKSDDYLLPKRYSSLTKGKFVFGDKESKFGHISEKTIHYTLLKLKERFRLQHNFSPASLRRNRMYLDFHTIEQEDYIKKFGINRFRYYQLRKEYKRI